MRTPEIGCFDDPLTEPRLSLCYWFVMLVKKRPLECTHRQSRVLLFVARSTT